MLYQTECTVSALANDSGSFILFTTHFKFNTNFSSQQTEIMEAIVFGYKAITDRLTPLGATASVERLLLNNLNFSSDFVLPRSKRW